MLTIASGATAARSARFLWPNKDGTGTVTDCGLHFRGDALLDDNGNGTTTHPVPGDGAEVSTICRVTPAPGCT